MKKLEDMTRVERSLLLYLETCLVDLCGRVDGRRINAEDREVIDRWTEDGFIDFGRIVAADINRQGNDWVEFSPLAWRLAHEERIARYERNPRRYRKTSEK